MIDLFTISLILKMERNTFEVSKDSIKDLQ